MQSLGASSASEFGPLGIALAVGMVCAFGGLFAARRWGSVHLCDHVTRFGMRSIAILGLAFGLCSMLGVFAFTVPPLAMVGAFFAGFLTLAAADLRGGLRSTGGRSGETGVAGTIAVSNILRRAA